MANFTVTQLLEARNLMTSRYTDAELRREIQGATNAFIASTPFCIPNLDAILASKKAEDQAVKVYIKNRKYTASGSTRDCEPTATQGEATEATLSFTTYRQTVYMSEKIAANNMLSLAEMYNHDLMEAMKSLWIDVNTTSKSTLETYKSGYNQDTLYGNTFDAVNDVLSTANAYQNEWFSRISTAMEDNYYNPRYQIIGNSGMTNLMKYLDQQGTMNATNLAWQFQDFDAYQDRVTNASTDKATCYATRLGNLALASWIPELNRRGFENRTGIWTTMPDLFGSGHTFAVRIYETCADTSSLGGATQDAVTAVEISADFAHLVAPIATVRGAGETTVFKHALAIA